MPRPAHLAPTALLMMPITPAACRASFIEAGSVRCARRRTADSGLLRTTYAEEVEDAYH